MKLSEYQTEDEFIQFISSDDSLFHYTSKEAALQYILHEGRFRFSLFDRSNDPFEYSNNKGIGITDNGEMPQSEIFETFGIIDKFFKQHLAYISFCTNQYNEGKLESLGCLKNRMWAQYGGNHEGICLVFSKSKLLKALDESLENKIIYNYINYLEDFDSIHDPAFHLFLENESSRKRDILNHLLEHRELLLFSKVFDFRDENEFRVIAVSDNKKINHFNNIMFPISECLEGFILGDKLSSVYYPSIEKTSIINRIPFKRLVWTHNQYLLQDVESSIDFFVNLKQ